MLCLGIIFLSSINVYADSEYIETYNDRAEWAKYEGLSDWAVSDVYEAYEAYENGLVPDYLIRGFNYSMLRRDFCVLCAAVLKKNGIEDSPWKDSVSFSDVNGEDKDTDPDILMCASLGIVSGTGNGKFEPNRNIMRQEAAAMLYRTRNIRQEVGFFTHRKFGSSLFKGLRVWAEPTVFMQFWNLLIYRSLS